MKIQFFARLRELLGDQTLEIDDRDCPADVAGLRALLRDAAGKVDCATVFGCWVRDPERYGVAAPAANVVAFERATTDQQIETKAYTCTFRATVLVTVDHGREQ